MESSGAHHNGTRRNVGRENKGDETGVRSPFQVRSVGNSRVTRWQEHAIIVVAVEDESAGLDGGTPSCPRDKGVLYNGDGTASTGTGTFSISGVDG